MKKLPDISLELCRYTHVLEVISNKWTALAIYAMEDGIIRYGEMKRRIEGISQKMLTQTLKQLERDGVVTRKLTPSVPPITEYSLTPLGESLLPIMNMLKIWAVDHYDNVQRARQEYDDSH
ncbi:transcriptional regulator [Paenibacillus glycanilyticus]|uniref:Transcriptional regulator n=1 Tax=Paenibacillus glycanilyticus TaxID=126569 RepID=A0ABQ6NVN8_9BACL|nr:helix-turn-helix domain-containing protein [Paenibacillus glycanilyticus]GMK48903.1 transcriptional regulator [Paenibacillus glycanilyticus]